MTQVWVLADLLIILQPTLLIFINCLNSNCIIIIIVIFGDFVGRLKIFSKHFIDSFNCFHQFYKEFLGCLLQKLFKQCVVVKQSRKYNMVPLFRYDLQAFLILSCAIEFDNSQQSDPWLNNLIAFEF